MRLNYMDRKTRGINIMPIDKNMSHSEIVKELMDAYKAKGSIGNTTIKDEKQALEISNAIAYAIKGEGKKK